MTSGAVVVGGPENPAPLIAGSGDPRHARRMVNDQGFGRLRTTEQADNDETRYRIVKACAMSEEWS